MGRAVTEAWCPKRMGCVLGGGCQTGHTPISLPPSLQGEDFKTPPPGCPCQPALFMEVV